MPKSAKYLAGFNLRRGLKLEGYVLERVSAGHIQVVRYRKYQYPTELIWKRVNAGASPGKLISALSNYLESNKTIYTAYNNPYSCNFGELELKNHGDGEMVHIEASGECDRI